MTDSAMDNYLIDAACNGTQSFNCYLSEVLHSTLQMNAATRYVNAIELLWYTLQVMDMKAPFACYWKKVHQLI